MFALLCSCNIRYFSFICDICCILWARFFYNFFFIMALSKRPERNFFFFFFTNPCITSVIKNCFINMCLPSLMCTSITFSTVSNFFLCGHRKQRI